MDSTKKRFQFFIITKGNDSKHLQLGSLCYISNVKYESEFRKTKKPTQLYVSVMGSYTKEDVMISDMSPLSTKEAELLYALEGDPMRLKWFQEKTALKSAVDLTLGTQVTVEGYTGALQGIIRYIGTLTELNHPDPISGISFGIELQGNDKGKGQHDGTIKLKYFFHCENNDGLFVPFSRIRPIVSTFPTAQQASFKAQSNQITQGETVSYLDDQSEGLWIVLGLGDNEGEPSVCIATYTQVSNNPVRCHRSLVVKNLLPRPPEPNVVMDASAALVEPQTCPATSLGVNSLVELTLSDGHAYGVIRWIGPLPGRADTMCGLELEDQRGVSDGMFRGTRHFSCAPKKALFVKLATCRPDSRFSNHSSANPSDTFANQKQEDEGTRYEGSCETVDPISTDQVARILIGRMKGIQGHCNSCYMDAALFSLFSCSSVLDSLLFKKMKPEDTEIQNTLLRNIVNPLRSQGFVEGKHIMKLRQQLLNHGYSHTFTTDEKDPEEFLTIIMQHIMALEPLLKLSAAGKVQESYCYQIFLDQNHSLVLPTIQQLLEHSFHSAGLKLAESPSCLILQMPRFGKKFKMFDKIIPSLELDITDLLTEGPQQCMICGQLALIECTECFKDPVFSQTGFKLFCKTCSTQVHSHPQRQAHRLSQLLLPRDFSEAEAPHQARDKLDLFAVLCIETSHYVSFVKHGPESQDWIFFDSMADREGGLNGFNIPQIQACPEVGEYLDMPPVELANQVPRDMKGVAKRLFCDAYMYLYKNTAQALYR
ncbi:unnamed protein product [Lota lota]